jgi:hypothetical protein
MLQSIYLHGVKGLEAVNRDSLRALPCPAVVGRDFVHQFVQLTFELPRSGSVQCKLSGLARPKSGRPHSYRLGGLVGSSVLVIRLWLPVYRAAHILAYIGVRLCHPAAQVGSIFLHVSCVFGQSGMSSEEHL